MSQPSREEASIPSPCTFAHPRCAGVLLLVAAALLNPYAMGRLLDPMEQLRDPRLWALVIGVEVCLALAGLVLLAFPRRIPWPRALGFLASGFLILAILVGAWANAMFQEWIRPAVKEPADAAAWLLAECEIWGPAGIERLQRELAEDRADGDAAEVVQTGLELADQLLWHGRNEESLTTLREAEAFAIEQGVAQDFKAKLARAFAIAWLRVGETSHCVQEHGRESCILPIRGDGVWRDPAPAREARLRLEEALQADPQDLSSVWLLNLACMVAGDPPASIPEPYRLPADAFATREEFPAFRDVAKSLGLDFRNVLGGVVMDDFDGDGNLDLIITSNHPAEGAIYVRNDGRGGFEDRSQTSGLAAHTGVFNTVQADYDGDGRLDLYLVRGAWGRHFGRQRDTLLRQQADGSFTDVTQEAGMADVAYPNLAAAWADYDRDGDLDLFVGGMRLSDFRTAPSQLYRNEGDGRFTDVADAAGVEKAGDVTASVWGDHDNDGDEDLFVANLRGPDRLYRNEGDGTFSDVAAAAGVAHTPPIGRSFGSFFFDYDNDGWLDLFVGDYGAWDLGAVAADYLGRPSTRVERSRLYRNQGDGTFRDVSAAAGVDRVWMPMGANFGDFDADGFLDFYLATGAPALGYLAPNAMLWNRGGERFVDVTFASRTGHLQKGHGVAIGDLDNDGDEDLYEDLGGLYPADVMSGALYENPGFGNAWLTVRLIGTRSNRSAIGARVRAILVEPDGERTVRAVVGTGGSFGGNSLQVELGAGRAERIRLLEITWPATGAKQEFHDLDVRRSIEITEGSDQIRTMDRRAIRFAPEMD